jgi:hypothetical protein
VEGIVAEIVTNRDLYFAVSQLIAQYRETTRSLEESLRALWCVADRHREQSALAPDEFFGVLVEAFCAKADQFDSEPWRPADLLAEEHLHAAGFQGWEYRVARQVHDLREMAENGQLADEMRYFGIDSPRRLRWYNFDPCGFLECALAGGFVRYDWEDDSESESAPLGAISWEQFRDFLGAGQWYE